MPTKNIIVFPTDFSDLSLGALPWVQRMTEKFDAELHCIYVVEEPPVYATLEMGPVPMPSIDELTGAAGKRMGKFAKQNLGKVTRTVTKILTGRPAQTILDYAAKSGATLIIMTTHGYSGLKHAFLGSTTEAVLRHANCPVLSIRSK